MDVQLEGEEYLGDVINELEIWLAKENFVIQNIMADTQKLELSQPAQWKDTPVNSVETLSMVAILAEEARLNHLETIAIYFSNLKEALLGSNKKVVADLLTDIEGVLNSVQSMLDPSFIKTAPINILLQELKAWENKASQTDLEPDNHLIQALDVLLSMVIIQVKELSNPKGEMEKTFKVLEDILPGLNDLSLMLQTGKDSEALNLVITLTEVLNKCMRLFPKYTEIHGKDMKELEIQDHKAPVFFQELNGIFNELGTAFESGDSILIGDLSEYEIAPRLESLLKMRQSL